MKTANSGNPPSPPSPPSPPARSIVTATLILLVSALATKAFGQSIAVAQCGGACPVYESIVSARQSSIVIHHLYAAGIDGFTALPNWVAYGLNADAAGVASLLPRNWKRDRLLKYSSLEDFEAEDDEIRLSESITRNNSPYGGGGMAQMEPEDRVRLAPMTSFANTPYWSELNKLSNMLPMPAALRLGPWLQLEQRLNRLVAAEGEVYVVAGPVFLINQLSLSPALADSDPAAYFKLVANDSGTVAFLFPKDTNQFGNLCASTTTLAELQGLTGLRFFPGRSRTGASRSLLSKLGCP